MKSSKRKTRSDTFPLTLHPTGQYCNLLQLVEPSIWALTVVARGKPFDLI